jgi:hypothetical protein
VTSDNREQKGAYPLEPGDHVHLRVRIASPDGIVSDATAANPLRDTVSLLLGRGGVPAELEQALVGSTVGDSGRIELTDEGAEPVTPVEEIVPDALAAGLKELGITTAWEFQAVNAETLATDLYGDPERVQTLQREVTEEFDAQQRRLVEYEITSAVRWRATVEDGGSGEPIAADGMFESTVSLSSEAGSSDKRADKHVEVRTDGVAVEKWFTRDEFPVPAMKFRITSERDDTVTVRLTDAVPEEYPMDCIGFHPNYDADHWHAFDDHRLEYERSVDPGEEVLTVYGMRVEDPTDVKGFLASPRCVVQQ